MAEPLGENSESYPGEYPRYEQYVVFVQEQGSCWQLCVIEHQIQTL